MAKKVLIAYDSLFGSTKGVAECIGKTFTENDIESAVKNVSEVSDLIDYDAVVLGSPIVRGLILDSTISFLKQFESSLQKTPLAVFCVCMSLIRNNTHNRFTIMQMLKTMISGVAKVNPVSWMGFAGAMDIEKLDEKAKERFISRGVPCGDWRNWDAIREWALNLPSLLFTST